MPNYSIKGKPKKIIMSNSQPTKIIRDNFFFKKRIKNIDFKRMRTKHDTKIKLNQIIGDGIKK